MRMITRAFVSALCVGAGFLDGAALAHDSADACPDATTCRADLNGDGRVNFSDLAIFARYFGGECGAVAQWAAVSSRAGVIDAAPAAELTVDGEPTPGVIQRATLTGPGTVPAGEQCPASNRLYMYQIPERDDPPMFALPFSLAQAMAGDDGRIEIVYCGPSEN